MSDNDGPCDEYRNITYKDELKIQGSVVSVVRGVYNIILSYLVFSPLMTTCCTSEECCHRFISRTNLQHIEVCAAMVALWT